MKREEIQEKIDWLKSNKPSPSKKINEIRQCQIRELQRKLALLDAFRVTRSEGAIDKELYGKDND